MVGAALGGLGGVIVVPMLGEEPDSEADAPIFPDFGRVLGVTLAFSTGQSLGSAVGVYIVGNIDNQTGSFLATLGGSALGSLEGILFAIYVYTGLSLDGSETALVTALIGLLLSSPIGATIGFNLTKEKEQKDSTAIHLEEGNISFALPRL